jgi:hypothetical protein
MSNAPAAVLRMVAADLAFIAADVRAGDRQAALDGLEDAIANVLDVADEVDGAHDAPGSVTRGSQSDQNVDQAPCSQKAPETAQIRQRHALPALAPETGQNA